MTSGAPWSVKGIDPKAREVAKDLARRSGMTLGEWLNRMILEDEGPEDLTDQEQFAQARAPARYEAPPRREEPPRHEAWRERREAFGFSPSPRLTPDRVADQIARAARDPISLRSGREYLQRPRLADQAPPRVEAPKHPADEIARVLAAVDRISERIAAAEARTGQAIEGVEQSVREAVARIETNERDQVAVAARFEGVAAELGAGQERIVERLRKYETDGSGPRSAEALHALEQALGKVANRLYETEGRTLEALGAVEGRLERLEEFGGGDPAGFADEVLGRLGERLAEAQAHTSEALEALRASFADLDGRLQAVEGAESAPAELRLEDLAASLTSRVEAARAEIAEKLSASADERFEQMERRLTDVAQHVSAAEHRSAEALEHMGREVLSVADSLNRKLQASEQRGAEAIQQVGGEMARIGAAVETRLGRVDNVHAEALERLSGEITRITERLGERIGAAERRSAQAVDEVGEKLARVTDKLNARHERASEDLAERIRQSEERTAKLLEDARSKIDRRLAEAQRQLDAPIAAPQRTTFSPFGAVEVSDLGPPEPDRRPEPVIAPPPPPLAAFPSAAASVPASEPAFDDVDFEVADGFERVTAEPAFEPQVEAGAAAASAPAEPAELLIDDEDGFSGDTDFLTPSAAKPAPATQAAPDLEFVPDPDVLESAAPNAAAEEPEAEFPAPAAEDEDLFEPQAAAEPARPLTTREIIDQARAAARSSSTNGDKKSKAAPAARPSAASLFAGFGLPKPKKRAASAMQTALLVAGGAAFLSVGAAGLVVMGAKPGGEPPRRVAENLGAGAPADPAPAAPFAQTPRAAIALAPQAVAPAPVIGGAAEAVDLPAAYDAAVRSLEAQEPGAVDNLRRSANLGYAPAQLYLASLYENGGHGVKKDLGQARQWTERAARGGDRKAMHNLALYAFEGVGGQRKNAPLAAQWFRRAADLGLVDSQYNLGRLYEQGLGVNQNPAEAYKWYLIAARSGDEESRSSAQRVRSRLSPDAQTVAERAASGFRSASTASASATALGQTQTASVIVAQRALSRLGYYQGPRDGVTSPALNMAIAAYQREQGLPASGALDDATVAKLEVFTR